MVQLKAISLTRWTARTDGGGLLAAPGTLDLGQAVLRHGSPVLQATFVHVATNSIHFFWLLGDDGKQHLTRLQCKACKKDLTLEHLFDPVCPAIFAQRFRSDLQLDLISLLTPVPCTARWLRAHRASSLTRQLASLFPSPPWVTSLDLLGRHRTLVSCGAFTRAQATSASRSLGFASAEDGRSTLLQMRLLCLQHIDALFRRRKEEAAR